ncbi:MAG: FixH family protein [Chitinophagaceae bacterium]
MNWGHKITFVILTFIACMITMVYIASKQTNEMFDSNYYEKELNYQNIINAANNLNALHESVQINQDNQNVVCSFPKSTVTNFKDGKIELLKADNSSKDVTQVMLASSNQYISKTKLTHGLYNIRISWNSNNIPYYFEQKIIITK